MVAIRGLMLLSDHPKISGGIIHVFTSHNRASTIALSALGVAFAVWRLNVCQTEVVSGTTQR